MGRGRAGGAGRVEGWGGEASIEEGSRAFVSGAWREEERGGARQGEGAWCRRAGVQEGAEQRGVKGCEQTSRA